MTAIENPEAKKLSRHQQLVGAQMKLIEQKERDLYDLNAKLQETQDTVNQARKMLEDLKKQIEESEKQYKEAEEDLQKLNVVVFVHRSASLEQIEQYSEGKSDVRVTELDLEAVSAVLVPEAVFGAERSRYVTNLPEEESFIKMAVKKRDSLVQFVENGIALIMMKRAGRVEQLEYKFLYTEPLITKLFVLNGVKEGEIPR